MATKEVCAPSERHTATQPSSLHGRIAYAGAAMQDWIASKSHQTAGDGECRFSIEPYETPESITGAKHRRMTSEDKAKERVAAFCFNQAGLLLRGGDRRAAERMCVIAHDMFAGDDDVQT